MKKLAFLLFGLSLFLSTVAFSQYIPTRGEIFNYDVNDVFHTTFYGFSSGGGFAEKMNITITSKYYSSNQDTIFYGRFILGMTSSSDEPQYQYYQLYDTIFYTQLNDTMLADTVFEDPNQYNGRKTISIESIAWGWSETKHTVGCGKVYYQYHSNEPYASAEFQLLYFKKGDEEWGEQIIIGIPAISNIQKLKTYPNPVSASSQTHLTFELPPITTETTIQITDIFGKTIAEFPLIKGQTQLVWNCSNIASGVYFYQTEIAGVVYRGKIVVN